MGLCDHFGKSASRSQPAGKAEQRHQQKRALFASVLETHTTERVCIRGRMETRARLRKQGQTTLARRGVPTPAAF